MVKISNSVHYALCSKTNLELHSQIFKFYSYFVLLYKLVSAHMWKMRDDTQDISSRIDSGIHFRQMRGKNQGKLTNHKVGN